MNLAVIVPRFNPCGYKQQDKNFVQFAQSLGQQVDTDDVFVIEVLYPGQTVADTGWWTRKALQAGGASFLWQKEALINFVISKLPPRYDAVAWIDADLLLEYYWHGETCRALEKNPVVQMFSVIWYLGPEPNEYTLSKYGHATAAVGDRVGFRAPGGAIACRRELLEHGIYDRHVLGGGDEIFMEACLGRSTRFCDKLNPAFRDHAREWCDKFGQHDVGYIPGTVKHLWHGDRAGRQYVERHQLLASHNFDPETDVRIGDNGLLEWSSDKPALHAAVRNYFRGRAEDQAEDQIPASVS